MAEHYEDLGKVESKSKIIKRNVIEKKVYSTDELNVPQMRAL